MDLLERAKVEPFIDSEPRQRLIAGLEIALAHKQTFASRLAGATFEIAAEYLQYSMA